MSEAGIYSPRSLPPVDGEFLRRHLSSSYKEMALALLQHLQIDVDTAILRQALDLYDRFDDAQNPVPVVKLGEGLFVSELYHGPTRAFKDMALQPFHLLIDTRVPVAWWIRVFKKCAQAPEARSIAIWLDQTVHIVCIAGWVALVKN